MNPYIYVQQATARGESLLALCCGIGLELRGLATRDVTAVDIAPQYIAKVHELCPQAKTVVSDALEYTKKQEDNSVDVVSIIDGIEHMDKETGLELISHAKRLARKEVLLFTPEGYLKNEPHNAWGVEGADHHQTHKSGWEVDELEGLGFDLIKKQAGISQHDEPYNALMFVYRK